MKFFARKERNSFKVLDGPEYTVESKIGEGTFSKVFKCKQPSGDVVAIKEIKVVFLNI